jgi:NAD(P)-dependent dehydrogenase (short-subunit alcohol dehydrogenase family)
METNLRAPFALSQALARQRPDGQSANIINLIDERVLNLTPHFVSYSIAKAGLWAATQILALALAPHIRVNAIGPGPTLPGSRQSQSQFDALAARQPLGHGAQPAEICRAVRFILDTPSMTGQLIALDGGQHLNWAPGSAAPLDL